MGRYGAQGNAIEATTYRSFAAVTGKGAPYVVVRPCRFIGFERLRKRVATLTPCNDINAVAVEHENCYGIKGLTHTLDFTKCKAYSM